MRKKTTKVMHAYNEQTNRRDATLEIQKFSITQIFFPKSCYVSWNVKAHLRKSCDLASTMSVSITSGWRGKPESSEAIARMTVASRSLRNRRKGPLINGLFLIKCYWRTDAGFNFEAQWNLVNMITNGTWIFGRISVNTSKCSWPY